MSNYDYIETGGVPIKAWLDGHKIPFDGFAKGQVMKLAEMPFIHSHVALMPDVHGGIGATVGSVIATKGAVIPAAVGVDIGCGMMAVETDLVASDLPDSLSAMRSAIEDAIPVGFSSHATPVSRPMAKEADARMPAAAKAAVLGMNPKKNPIETMALQLGTLGGGNHFIEICLDERDVVWFMLHSGSRGIGNLIGRYFIEQAKEDMRAWMINLPDKDLAYLPEGTQHYRDYMDAVMWAQDYARKNREMMMGLLGTAVEKSLGRPIRVQKEAVNCHHNYVEMENHFGANVLVTRKGAVRARKGDLGIIPGSMGARSYIVEGLGNPDSFHSCSHGAGRVMSRGEAKKKITVEMHQAATEGVECRKDEGVLDESPAAYKDIDAVMEAQRDLVKPLHTLRQVLCVKG